jgi:hypothetical protein
MGTGDAGQGLAGLSGLLPHLQDWCPMVPVAPGLSFPLGGSSLVDGTGSRTPDVRRNAGSILPVYRTVRTLQAIDSTDAISAVRFMSV